MTPRDPLSRRRFLAASTIAAGAAEFAGPTREAPAAQPAGLAIEGGPKAVADPTPPLERWGAAERERMNALVDQKTMFYWKGPQTTLLVQRFREACPLDHVMTCSSGTAALHIAAAAVGVGPGDEVITAPISDIGSVIGAIYQQAVPVFADLVPDTYNLDPADVARRVTPRTKAIIAVHLAGNPCDLTALRALADQAGLVLIEDCAQAWGATYGGRPIGTVGHIACFSLQASKHVTSGEGGVVASSDPKFGPRLQRFGDKGMDRLKPGGLFEDFSTNYRMSEPQAAFAAAQLTRLEGIAERRGRLGNLLTAELSGVPGIMTHQVRAGDRCTYWFYMLRLRPGAFRCDRATFVRALVAEGAPASAGYIPVPLYGNPVFRSHGFFAGRWPIREMGLTAMDYSKVSCPEAEAILETGVKFAIHEGMSEAYVRQVAEAVRKVARHFAA